MREPLLIPVLLVVTFAACTRHAVAEECSTEKVNGSDCTVTVDRSYPVAIPTIQMRHGRKVTVKVMHPLPFENLSLDLQTAQALAGTDQTSGLMTAALANLKGLLLLTQMNPAPSIEIQAIIQEVDPKKKCRDDINGLENDMGELSKRINIFATNSNTVYDQLNEVLGSIPPALILMRMTRGIHN